MVIMKISLAFLLVVCAIALTYAQEDDVCQKTCPKNFKRVSALSRDGFCVTYNNKCLLQYDILCEKQSFEKCFKGDKCLEDEAKQFKCVE